MKFILTGCTGFIGSEVLQQCLRNPTVTSVIALSRWKFSESVNTDLKLKLVIMKDFNLYLELVLKELAGADACIWCILFPSSSFEGILV
jgi:dTDP-D-glucose 4,6-dehydratase